VTLMYPHANWSRFHQERRNTEAELEETVEDDDTIPPPSPHRQDATPPTPKETR